MVDNIRPLDYEVFSVQRLGGSASEKRYEQEFRPFYSTLSADDGNYGAYFSLRREQRTLSNTPAAMAPAPAMPDRKCSYRWWTNGNRRGTAI